MYFLYHNFHYGVSKINGILLLREMLTNALRVLIKNPIKKSFYGEKKNN